MDGRGTPGQADKKDQARTENTLKKTQLHPLRGLSSNSILNALLLRGENRMEQGPEHIRSHSVDGSTFPVK